MPSATITSPAFENVADLLNHLGAVPPERVRIHPEPGTATERDVLDIEAREDRLCELVDGVLVEKPTGYRESRLAMILGHFLEQYLEHHDLGVIAGEAGMLRLEPGLIRIPDVSFVSWDQLPGGELPDDPIPDLVPDLAVEVLSESNTKQEMDRKLKDYFSKGVRLAWLIDPRSRTIRVHTSPSRSRLLSEKDTLDGGKVLPGFTLALSQLFARAARRRRRS